jgi:hypothetical protein
MLREVEKKYGLQRTGRVQEVERMRGRQRKSGEMNRINEMIRSLCREKGIRWALNERSVRNEEVSAEGLQRAMK